MVNRVRKQVSRSIGNTRPVEIVIKAQDQASRTFIQIKNEMSVLNAAAAKLGQGLNYLGSAFSQVGVVGGEAVSQLYSQVMNLKTLIEQPMVLSSIVKLGQDFQSATMQAQNFTTTFRSISTLSLGTANAAKVGAALGNVLGSNAVSSFGASINLIDKKVMELWGTVTSIGGKITPGVNMIMGASKGLLGISEPIELFRGMQEGVRRFSGGLIGAIQEIGQLQMGLSALQQVANFGPFNALIRQNIEFREQLVSTQSSLAATNDVILGGTTLTNTANAIKALEGPVRASIQKMRRDSLELVGVTSKDLVGVYNILASQVSSVGGGLNDASNLTIDFAAALGTMGIPLHQAQQEITSILRAQVDQNSALAKSIGLTNQQLNSWKSQGVLIDRVRERLEAFAEGNKMAARSVGGISSNIQEVFDNIFMAAGEQMLDPVIDKLSIFYEVLNKNALDIRFFVSDIVKKLIEMGEAVFRMVAKIGAPIAKFAAEITDVLVSAAAKFTRIFEEVFNAVLPAIEPIMNFMIFLAENAESVTAPFLRLFLAAGALKGTVATLGPLLKNLGSLFPWMGEAMAVLEGRSSSLLGQFANLSQNVQEFNAVGLLALKNFDKIPGGMEKLSGALGPLKFLAPALAPVIPILGSAAIALVGFGKNLPSMIDGYIDKVPKMIDGMIKTASSTQFAGTAIEGYIPWLQKASEASKAMGKTASESVHGIAKYVEANDLITKANAKMEKMVKDSTKAMVQQFVQMGLYSGAVFALFFAFDNLILKNEGVMAVIKELGEYIVELGTMIMDFMRNPVVSVIIALGALSTLIAIGVIPNMIKMGIEAAKTFQSSVLGHLGEMGKIFTSMGDGITQLIAKYMGLTVATEASTGADVKKVTVGSIVEAQRQRILALYNAEMTTITQKNKILLMLYQAEIAKTAQETVAKEANTAATTRNAAATGLLGKAKAWLSARISMATAALGRFGAASLVAARGLFTGMISAISSVSAAMGVLVAKMGVMFGAMKAQGISGIITQLGLWAKSTFSVTAAKTTLIKVMNYFHLQALRARLALVTFGGALKTVTLANLKATFATMGLGNSLKLTSIAANFQTIMKWAFAAEFATSRTAAWGVANKLLIGGLKGAALAAKGLITTLGPMALAVVAIAAAAEAVRILHQEFFAGNKILKEYLESIEEAQTKLENSRYQRAPAPGETTQETYWQDRLNTSQGIQEDKNMLSRGFGRIGEWWSAGTGIGNRVARLGYTGTGARAVVGGVTGARRLLYGQGADGDGRRRVTPGQFGLSREDAEGMNTLEGALQALADNEAGRRQLSESQVEYAKAVARSLDRDIDTKTASNDETLTAANELLQKEEEEVKRLQGEMTQLVADYNAGNITDEQFETERTRINQNITNAIDYLAQNKERLSGLEGLNKGQRAVLTQITEGMDQTAEAYGNIDSAAIAQKDVARTGSQYDQLTRQATTAEEFITKGKGDPAEYANQAKELIESTNQMLEAGMISEEEAVRRLNLLTTNTRLDAGLIAQAQESLTKAVEGQSQRRVQALQAEQSSVQAQMRQGTLTQVKGAEKLKTLMEQEGQERLDALKTQYENATNARNAEREDSLRAQQATLDDLREQLAEAGPDTVTGKQIAEEIAAAVAAMANTRKSYADQALVAEQNYNNERIKIANETAENVIAAEERVHEAKVRLLEQTQEEAMDAAKKVQLDTDILNQQLLNSGIITKEELAARNAESQQESIREELKAEKDKLVELEKLPKLTDPEKERERQAQIRAARLKTQELTLQILRSEREEVETNIGLLEKELTDAAREYGNQLETQIKSLERQAKIGEQLTRSYENRVKLVEAENSLRDATSSYVTSEFELLAETTKSDYRKKQIAQATAAIKLESAKMAFEFAKQSLLIEYEQNKLARERELIENRMAILRAEQAVAQGEVAVQVAQEKFNAGLITKGELDAAIIQQQGNQMQLEFAQQERGLILEQQANDERIFGMRAQQVEMDGRSSIRQAEVGLANALPPGLRERAFNQIGENIAQDAGYESRSSMINSGMALARQTAQESFGVGRSVGTLSAFDPTLEGLRENLSPRQYAAAVADSQRQYRRQMGQNGYSMQQDQLLGRGAEAFSMPSPAEASWFSPGGARDIAPSGLGQQISEGVSLGMSTAMSRDVRALPAADTATLGARDTDRMIAALEGGGRGDIQLNPVFQIEVNASSEEAGSAIAEQVHRELERVIEKSRELLRAA